MLEQQQMPPDYRPIGECLPVMDCNDPHTWDWGRTHLTVEEAFPNLNPPSAKRHRWQAREGWERDHRRQHGERLTWTVRNGIVTGTCAVCGDIWTRKNSGRLPRRYWVSYGEPTSARRSP